MEEDWDLLRQIQEIDFNTAEYEDQCKKVDKKEDQKDDKKEDQNDEKNDDKKEDVPPTLAELRRLRLAKFSPS
jgi:hypothetical protein